MQSTGLIRKLVDAGVIEKNATEVTFSERFGRYLVDALAANSSKAGTLPEWRDMLTKFHPSLENLSQDEIAKTIVLLDYHVENIELQLRRK